MTDESWNGGAGFIEGRKDPDIGIDGFLEMAKLLKTIGAQDKQIAELVAAIGQLSTRSHALSPSRISVSIKDMERLTTLAAKHAGEKP